ncbi:MAG TPA: iron ABC transporter permease [Actinomycetota bacterium]|nr:iron ABC transporter permease [Actinomycetota bacterium]
MAAVATPAPATAGPVPLARSARLRVGWLLAGAATVIVAVVAALVVGPVRIPAGEVVRELLWFDTDLTDVQRAILWDIRLPRVVLGLLVGSTLAVSGASYQGVFRNPLADPYLLGAAAGAGVGVTVVIVSTAEGSDLPFAAPLAAFVGALAAVALTYVLGVSGGGARVSTASLILAGVAVASFLTAIQTFVQQREDETLREVYGWILGRLTTAGWREVALVVPYALLSTAAILLHGRLIDVLAVGDEEASSLGVRAARVRLVVVAAATLATAAAVAVSGLIGFVGIIVPHTIRLLAGSSHRLLAPLSLIAGAAFLILADLAARTVMAPAELPIGVVTAIVGAPFFALVLRGTRRVP